MPPGAASGAPGARSAAAAPLLSHWVLETTALAALLSDLALENVAQALPLSHLELLSVARAPLLHHLALEDCVYTCVRTCCAMKLCSVTLDSVTHSLIYTNISNVKLEKT